MKHILIVAAALVGFTSLPLAAQQVEATSGAVSGSSAKTSLYLDQRAPGKVTTKSSGGIKNTPSLAGVGVASANPCIIPFGVTGVEPGLGLGVVISLPDAQCRAIRGAHALQNVSDPSAIAYMAQNDEKLCTAMKGRKIQSDYPCTAKEKRERRALAKARPPSRTTFSTNSGLSKTKLHKTRVSAAARSDER